MKNEGDLTYPLKNHVPLPGLLEDEYIDGTPLKSNSTSSLLVSMVKSRVRGVDSLWLKFDVL